MLSGPPVSRHIDAFDWRNQVAGLPCTDVCPLFGDEFTDVDDLNRFPLAVGFESITPKSQLDGPTLALVASRQMVRVPLEPHIGSTDSRLPLIVVIKESWCER